MKISACVIAKNEEENIARCLASYRDIVNEIILVDTGSTDRTVEIARQYNAKVFHFQWHNDFAAAKNFALERAKGQWILFLDADEYLDERTAKKLPSLLEKIQKPYNAIGGKIINIDIDQNNKIIDAFINVRIFKGDKHIRYRNKVHETLQHKTGKIHVLALWDEINIYHTGYSSNIIKKKAERNLAILLDNIQKRGDNPEDYRYLSDCYLSIGDYEKSIQFSRLHIVAGVKSIGYESKPYKNIVDALYLMQAPKHELEAAIESGIERFPDHPNFYYLYGFFLQREKQYNKALQYLLKAVELHEAYKGIEVNFAAAMLHEIYFRIGFLYQLKNQEDKALHYYYQSLRIYNHNKLAFHALYGLIYTATTTDKVELLNELFNVDNEYDVEFLVEELKRIKAGETYGYYVSVWRNKFNREDNSLAFLLLAMGRYETAFSIFYNGVYQEEANAILASVALIALRDEKNLEKLLPFVNSSMQNILNKYFGKHIYLNETDVEQYLILLREVLLLNDQEITERYYKLAEDFSLTGHIQMAKIFQEYCLYALAIQSYGRCLRHDLDNSREASAILMGLGYCYYKAGQYDTAMQYFEKAVKCGYKDFDVYEFKSFIEELTGKASSEIYPSLT